MIEDKKRTFRVSLILAILLILLPACQPAAPTAGLIEETIEITEDAKTPATATEVATTSPEKQTEEPVEAPAMTPTVAEVVEDEPSLPPEPIAQTIVTSDGTELMGQLYPADKMEAPLLVLFHWAPGDQTDWRALAAWFQNRGYQPELPDTPPPWLDATWFPEIPEGVSFHVLTFTFRGCDGGCQSFDREGWLLDAAAVMEHLQTLEDIKISQVVTIGASIGADGAPYGCHYYNEMVGGCQGALSLSPGGYLTIPYSEEVDALGSEEPPKPAWCLYSTGDGQSADACENASGDHYRAISYPGSAHGMAIIEEGQEPNSLELILEFLRIAGLCADCP